MGQYYMVYTEDKNGKVIVYNRYINGEYTMAKLLEHSWWNNPFVNTVCKQIFKKPKRVAWVGDYSDDDNKELYDSVWGDNVVTKGLTEAQVSLFDKFLVNHTQKRYIHCNEYYKASVDKDIWCIHPLPILTCIGNGKGGGDYRGMNMNHVGSWCLDKVSVELKPPKGYSKFITSFKEGRKD